VPSANHFRFSYVMPYLATPHILQVYSSNLYLAFDAKRAFYAIGFGSRSGSGFTHLEKI
jgi:hypothetical protein